MAVEGVPVGPTDRVSGMMVLVVGQQVEPAVVDPEVRVLVRRATVVGAVPLAPSAPAIQRLWRHQGPTSRAATVRAP